MKRKEMVDKIYTLLRQEEYIGTGYYEMADIILTMLEEEGMIPPFSHDHFISDFYNDTPLPGHKWDKNEET